MIDEMKVLRAANPAPSPIGKQGLDLGATRQLAVILDVGRPRGRRWTVWVAGAAAVLLLSFGVSWVGFPGAHPASAQAATPPVLVVRPLSGSMGSVLKGLASTSTKQATLAPDAARRVRYQEWSLSVRVDDQTVTTAVVPVIREVQWSPDLAGTTKSTIGQPQFPSDASKRAWEEDGARLKPGTVIDDSTFAPGKFPLQYTGAVPDRPAELREYLAVGHPIDQYGPGELFTAITDLAIQRTLTPSQQAAMLQLLAATPDVSLMGRVTDRAGRTGVAVSAEGDFTGLPTRWVLVFDPKTGRLLASESWLTKTAGKLPVTIPAVTDYKIW